MSFDTCTVEYKGVISFRPRNHPLGQTVCCKKCKAPTVSLPAYPGDWFDCDSCGHSWEPTVNQRKKMYHKENK